MSLASGTYFTTQDGRFLPAQLATISQANDPAQGFTAPIGQLFKNTTTGDVFWFNGSEWNLLQSEAGEFDSITSTGDITTTAGNVIISGAAKQLRVEGGAVTDFIGTATLASGEVTVANTNIAAADRIFIQRQSAGSSTALGELTYTISAGASFTITSKDLSTPANTVTGDVSVVSYFIVRQL